MKLFIIITLLTASINTYATTEKPEDIVNIKDIIPNIDLDIRYHSDKNFLGVIVDAYRAPKCFLHKDAAQSLKLAQQKLKKLNLKLFIYDCYRPQDSVNHFVRWAKDLSDTKMKHIFYPEVKKNQLFSSGYIAARSGHSRASTIDLSIIQINADVNKIKKLHLRDCRKSISKEAKNLGVIEMGSTYDCFDSLSHTQNSSISEEAKFNRNLLKKTLENVGFKNYSKEWWHFTYKGETYPNIYFNFPIE